MRAEPGLDLADFRHIGECARRLCHPKAAPQQVRVKEVFVVHQALLLDDTFFDRAPRPRQAAGAGVISSVVMGDPLPRFARVIRSHSYAASCP